MTQALFADHYLATRLKDDAAWKCDPAPAFAAVRDLLHGARERFADQPEQVVREQLYEPLWKLLRFNAAPVKKSDDPAPKPDYRLAAPDGSSRTAALVYAWERCLDGPDVSDDVTPGENPGAAVISLLERGDAEWVIVTNGRYWRLYSRKAQSRSTNFYEVDLEAVLLQSGEADPYEGFQSWWLFFREAAFAPAAGAPTSGTDQSCWLDAVAAGSREYVGEVEAALRSRVFHRVVPLIAAGFLEDRHTRLGLKSPPTQEELEQIREATLTLLYRAFFLLYAESRDLMRESGYRDLTFKKMKEEIAARAGIAESEADERLAAAYAKTGASLYKRLEALFAMMAGVDPKVNAAVNVPDYNGGFFRVGVGASAAGEMTGDPGTAAKAAPTTSEHRERESGPRPDRESAITSFLNERQVSDVYLARAIDGLARVPDVKRGFELVFIDYKNLGVRQLGSIYEGLLEYKLKLATNDMPAAANGGVKAKGRRKAAGRAAKSPADPSVKAREPYLATDKAKRKATGSFYTPDPIVVYIVANTVGPVLKRKLEALRPGFEAAGKSYSRWHAAALADPRVMLGWRAHNLAPNPTAASSGAAERHPRIRTEAERRLFALSKTCEDHKQLVEQLFDFKVLDPAMGSGHFLVNVMDFITDELLHFLNDYPDNPLLAALAHTRANIIDSLTSQHIEAGLAIRQQLTDVRLLKRHVLKRCIYGVDLDPLATELAKVSLWLDAFAVGAPLTFLDHHLCCGNSLIGRSIADLEGAGVDSQAMNTLRMFSAESEPDAQEAVRRRPPAARGFDAVVCNPPYSGHKKDVNGALLKAFFPVCKNYANLATAFCELSVSLLRGGGRYGLIIPKSIQYVESWVAARRLLAIENRLEQLVDASEAFDDVLLEQSVCIGERGPAGDTFLGGRFAGGRTADLNRVPLLLCRELDCLPALVDSRSLALLRRIESLGPRLGHVSHTNQALGYQAHVTHGTPPGNGKMRIFRGRHIRPLRIDSSDDWIDESHLREKSSGGFTKKVARMLVPKVISQNIVAHVTRPKPRVWVISAPDPAGVLCLNTISVTLIHDHRFSIEYVSLVLNSSLASWFYYEFAFCRAVRTMHFDQYYAGKLPLASPPPGIAEASRSAAAASRTLPRIERQQMIDQFVFDAYGLTPKEQSFIHEYCYGVDRSAALSRQKMTNLGTDELHDRLTPSALVLSSQ